MGDRFEDFWLAYPRKTAKQAARKAWGKLRPDDALVDTMIRAILQQRQSRQWKEDGGRYIPHPATWLNGRRWEDEVPGVGIPEATRRHAEQVRRNHWAGRCLHDTPCETYAACIDLIAAELATQGAA